MSTAKNVKMIRDSEALEKVGDDIIVLLTKEPFYAYLLVKMKKVIDSRVPVAGVSVVDGEIKLYINPEGYLKYTKPERIFILKHEVLHIINIHYLRRRDRDPSLFNVAADIAINQLIEAPHCQMPIDALRPDHYQLPLNLSSEDYYNMLWQRNEKIDIPQDILQGMGKHLSGASCPHCDGTGHEPKPKKIKGVIEEINPMSNRIKISGKTIQIEPSTTMKDVDGSNIDFDDLNTGMLAEVEGFEKAGYIISASTVAIQKIKGKITEIDEVGKRVIIDKFVLNVSDETAIFNDEKEEIDFSDLAVDMTVEMEGEFVGTVKAGFEYDASEISIVKNEEKEDEDDDKKDDGDGDGDDEGEGDESCSSCGGSGKDPSGSSSGEGSGRAPGFADLHPTWDESSEVSEQLAESIVRSMVQDAYQKSRGNVPGSIAQMIDDILKSKVNWRSILRNFVAKRRSTSRSGTWKKRNRRLGSLVMGYRKHRKLNLVIAVDTSGSVSDKELALFNGEMQKIFQSKADMTVIECDAQIQSVYKYTKKIDRSGATFKGRGGTDFRPVFKYIMEEMREKPDAVIFLTDGYGPAPDVFKIPTLWCLTPGGRRPYNNSMGGEVKWGKTITLED